MHASGVETLTDLEQLAARLGMRVPHEDLARWGPWLLAFLGDLDRLALLPVAGLEPALTPGPPRASGTAGSGPE